MISKRRASAIMALLLLATSARATAAEHPEEQALGRFGTSLNDAMAEELTVPESPAAFTLGASVEQIAHPGTLAEASAQLISLLTPDGAFRPGVAAEIAPLSLALPKIATLQDWKDAGYFRRLAESTRLSFATVEDPAVSDDSAAKTLVAVGIRLSIIDTQSVLGNATLRDAVGRALVETTTLREKEGEERETPVGDVVVPEPSVALRKLDRAVREAYDKFGRRGHVLELAAVTSFASAGSVGSGLDTDWRDLRVWLAHDWRWGKHGSLGWALDTTLVDQDGAKPAGANNDTTLDLRVGARVNLESKRVGWSLETLYLGKGFLGDDVVHAFSFGTTVRVRVYESFALSVGYLGAVDDSGRFGGTVIATVGWAGQSVPFLQIPHD